MVSPGIQGAVDGGGVGGWGVRVLPFRPTSRHVCVAGSMASWGYSLPRLLSLSLSLSSWAPPLRLPPLWQAINASNEPTAHCHLGQMLWEGTAFLSTPHRTALEEATAHFNTK